MICNKCGKDCGEHNIGDDGICRYCLGKEYINLTYDEFYVGDSFKPEDLKKTLALLRENVDKDKNNKMLSCGTLGQVAMLNDFYKREEPFKIMTLRDNIDKEWDW